MKHKVWMFYPMIVVGVAGVVVGVEDSTTGHVGVRVGVGAGDIRFRGPSCCRRRRAEEVHPRRETPVD